MAEIQYVDGADGARVAVAQAFVNGKARFVIGNEADGERRRPEECDHAGSGWSQDMYLSCARCGAPMVLPALVIARKSVDEIGEMEQAWEAAGRPRLRVVGSNGSRAWQWDVGEGWRMTEHRLFEHLGGLPVRKVALGVGEEFGDEDGAG